MNADGKTGREGRGKGDGMNMNKVDTRSTVPSAVATKFVRCRVGGSLFSSLISVAIICRTHMNYTTLLTRAGHGLIVTGGGLSPKRYKQWVKSQLQVTL